METQNMLAELEARLMISNNSNHIHQDNCSSHHHRLYSNHQFNDQCSSKKLSVQQNQDEDGTDEHQDDQDQEEPYGCEADDNAVHNHGMTAV